eukprot:TRINITY_DN14488_c0_g1_i6.p1 TRINITY_DN14488_c0_g1~~TRINITY_DN14488_c0_g1_i6.p1  ORF type:complete len:105 (+),score=8.78 TRINITY_DN14488_c0_g1_i6:244-558(+)
MGYENWYRVVGAAGTQVAVITGATADLQCGGYYANGWPSDESLPSSPGENKFVTHWYTYVTSSGIAWLSHGGRGINATNCDGFYVFKFPEIKSGDCPDRYCTQN